MADGGYDPKAHGAAWGKALSAAAEENPDVEEKQTRRGRPKGSGSGSGGGSPDISTPSISYSGKELRPLVKALGNTICRSSGVSTLADSEAEEISEALAPVMSKYFGTALDRFGPEIALAGVLVKVSLPRVQEYRENLPEPDSEEPRAAEIRDDF